MGGKRASIGPRCAFCLRSAQQAPCRPPVWCLLPAHPRRFVPLMNGFPGLPGFRWVSAWLRHRASLRIIGPQSIAAFVAYLFFGLLFGRCGCWPSAALASALFLRHVGGLRPPQPPGLRPSAPFREKLLLSHFPALLRLFCGRALISSSLRRARAGMLQNALRGAGIISAFCRSGRPPLWFPSAGWELPGWLCACRPRHFARYHACPSGLRPPSGGMRPAGRAVRVTPPSGG